MVVTFETRDYGRIEADTEAGEAYFYSQDYCSPIDAFGRFADWHGTEFQLIHPWPGRQGSPAHLEVIRPVSVGLAIPA